MNLPDHYNDIRAVLRVDQVSYGCGGIKLFNNAEIEQAQVGYSVTPGGKSLCSPDRGSWRENWTVIGYETACGDPLFIDTNDAALPVLTAVHGQGAWEAEPVAISIDAFAHSLAEFARLSKHRSNPLERDQNPISSEERDRFLRQVAALNREQFEPDFWAILLEC